LQERKDCKAKILFFASVSFRINIEQEINMQHLPKAVQYRQAP